MHIAWQKTRGWSWAFVMVATLWFVPALYAGNEVMGELQFEGKSKVERTSGVWIDGGYVGYLKELKGSKKVLLLPGEHAITVRQDGYEDFTERLLIQPGDFQDFAVDRVRGGDLEISGVLAEAVLNLDQRRQSRAVQRFGAIQVEHDPRLAQSAEKRGDAVGLIGAKVVRGVNHRHFAENLGG